MAQTRTDRRSAGASATRLAAALALCAAAGTDGAAQLDRSIGHAGRICSAAWLQEEHSMDEGCRPIRNAGETWRLELVALDGTLFEIGGMTILGLFASKETRRQNRA